jgi:alkylation response protein AidB-like acyl-CoA dehydrogenase
MDFTLTDEQRMMVEAFRGLAEEMCAPAEIRAAFEGRSSAGVSRWARMAQMGLAGMLAPTDRGGSGLSALDFSLIAEEAGRVALPEPLSEHAGVAVPLLAELAVTPAAVALLERAARGDSIVAVMHESNPYVLLAEDASHLVVCRGDEVHVVPMGAARITLAPSIDALRRLASVDLVLDASTLIARGEAATKAAARAFERGALFAAAECVGLAERMIGMAVAYAQSRTQFGKPIGTYQAIKHALASCQVKVEFARPVVHGAAARQGEITPRLLALVSHSKLAAADAADLAARSAIQVHGAMGYSWEVDLHFFMKRAWALAGTWGDRNFHARRLQSLLIDGKIVLGPDRTFDA